METQQPNLSFFFKEKFTLFYGLNFVPKQCALRSYGRFLQNDKKKVITYSKQLTNVSSITPIVLMLYKPHISLQLSNSICDGGMTTNNLRITMHQARAPEQKTNRARWRQKCHHIIRSSHKHKNSFCLSSLAKKAFV